MKWIIFGHFSENLDVVAFQFSKHALIYDINIQLLLFWWEKSTTSADVEAPKLSPSSTISIYSLLEQQNSRYQGRITQNRVRFSAFSARDIFLFSKASNSWKNATTPEKKVYTIFYFYSSLRIRGISSKFQVYRSRGEHPTIAASILLKVHVFKSTSN